jgi:putative Holliday junction resolvase
MRIAELVGEHAVSELVVGLPITMSGELGSQARLVQLFADELRAGVAIPVHLFDERLTTVAAERMMLDLGMRPEQRRARLDEVAASIILQDFLDSLRAGRPPAQEPEGYQDDE